LTEEPQGLLAPGPPPWIVPSLAFLLALPPAYEAGTPDDTNSVVERIPGGNRLRGLKLVVLPEDHRSTLGWVTDVLAEMQHAVAGSGELTPTFELKRRVIAARCAAEIEELYSGSR
jgi:hypothetical protein